MRIVARRPGQVQAMEVHRLRRLLEMQRMLIAAAAPVPRRELAEHFGVSERRISQDIQLMRLAGIDVRHIQPRGYYIFKEA